MAFDPTVPVLPLLLTNDGNGTLGQVDVAYSGAKNMIELSGTQDEECGDGTTSLERDIHPVVIISAYNKMLAEALSIIQRISVPFDTAADAQVLSLIKTSTGTKFVARWSDMMCKFALQAVRSVAAGHTGGQTSIDIKRYVRVEKIPIGEIEASRVLSGVLLNKDITHPAMRHISNPCVILLDCPLEYTKGESRTNMEFSGEGDWARAQEIEEEQVRGLCERLLEMKPGLVVTKKGVSGLALHIFAQANVSALRRVRKSDNNPIALAVGATIGWKPGPGCGLLRVEKIGDKYFIFLTECHAAKPCTVLLRGSSKHILNEIDPNLADAMSVTCNPFFNPTLGPGGGPTDVAIGVGLQQKARSSAVQGVETWPYRAVLDAMEVISPDLSQNSGGNVIRVLTELRGVLGGVNRLCVQMASTRGIQTLKTAIEAVLKEQDGGARSAGGLPEEMIEAQ
ncbi:hypothetical protein CVT25_014620 [Psilocybe cyanescens]|uniref:T-complex protein 1 subunit gamma n=1 Tax=Psilocybe cyanescens TaxID=93625 RepID=A0A409WU88_PSICY|nr:hypothetical protein CVT25_014620 [Psilocybe cyanescens]